jgi:DNA-binding NtrC family response regulator
MQSQIKVKILIVDDESDIVDSLRRYFEIRSEHVRVYGASSFAEAMFKLQNDNIEVLITDVGLGKKDGIELYRSIGLDRTIKKPKQVYFMSCAVNVDKFKDVQGKYRVFQKPLNFEIIWSAIAKQFPNIAKGS